MTRRELELRGRTHTGRLPGRTCWRGCPNGSGVCPENLTRAHALVRARDRLSDLLGHGRFGVATGKRGRRASGVWAPPSMGRLCAMCQTLGCQACTIQENCSARPRCREPWPGSESLKTVGAQFSVLRRTFSVSELCIIFFHAAGPCK